MADELDDPFDDDDDAYEDDGFEWTEVPGTSAAFRWEQREHQGVTVLMVWLRGWLDRRGHGVTTLCEALDALPAHEDLDAEVAVLTLGCFLNADDDVAQNLTSALRGLACCWVVSDWHWDTQTDDGRRWDIPPRRWLAVGETEALNRVVSLRKAGRFWATPAGMRLDEAALGPNDEVCEIGVWTERGYERTQVAIGMRDLYFRNRLVERVIQPRGEGPVRRIAWPVPDASGIETEAQRRNARLIYEDDRLIEVDPR